MKATSLKSQRRKKIWQIQAGFHCSIIRICLGRVDLQRLKRKKVFGLSTSSTDYEIHNAFTGVGDGKSAQGRFLQKALDTKYAHCIKSYAALFTDEELWNRWQEDCRKNNVSGAYWAIMTHDAASDELLSRVYGECHMLSFDTFGQQRTTNTLFKRLEGRLLGEVRKSVSLAKKLQLQQKTNEELRKASKEKKNSFRG